MTPHTVPRAGARRRCRPPALIAGSAVLLAGCDLALLTEPPILEHRWIVPADETRFGVAELLPGDVTLTPDESAFIIDFDAITFAESLASLCPACAIADGMTVPKPPFLGNAADEVAFPPEVTSITVVSGQVLLEVVNGLNFDPLRPAAGAFGSLTLTITDDADGEVLASLVVEGEATPFPPGSLLGAALDLSGATVEGAIVAEATIDSPLGDPVTIDSAQEISVVATPVNVQVSQVTIEVAGEQVDFDPVELEVDDLEDIVDRVEEGAFVVDVTNPFGITADFQLTISIGGVPSIQKEETIPPDATSTVLIAFTRQELQSFLGKQQVVLTGTGVVDAGAGPIAVTPGLELVLDASFDVTLLIGD